MNAAELRKKLQLIEERKNVKYELPYDCKHLMFQCRSENYRRDILFRLSREAWEPYHIDVDNITGLSLEAKEFLSLSADRQLQAVDYYFPEPSMSKGEAEELRRDILERLNR